MRFQVPQFIERETRIAGPLTFKQFVMLGMTAGIILLIYLALAKANFFVFVLISIMIVGAALALAFLNVGGRSLPLVLGNFLSFFVSPKIYLWKKKELPPRIIWKKTEEKKKNHRAPDLTTGSLKVAEKSRLKQVAADIEVKR